MTVTFPSDRVVVDKVRVGRFKDLGDNRQIFLARFNEEGTGYSLRFVSRSGFRTHINMSAEAIEAIWELYQDELAQPALDRTPPKSDSKWIGGYDGGMYKSEDGKEVTSMTFIVVPKDANIEIMQEWEPFMDSYTKVYEALVSIAKRKRIKMQGRAKDNDTTIKKFASEMTRHIFGFMTAKDALREIK